MSFFNVSTFGLQHNMNLFQLTDWAYKNNKTYV